MHVIIMRGAPRSGKSTLTRVFRKMWNNVAVVSADDYYIGPMGRYSYDKDLEPEAHRSCFRRFLGLMERVVEVIVVDNTASRLLEASPYVLAAEAHGYVVKVVTVTCAVEKMLERNAASERGQIPNGLIEVMAERIAKDDAPPWWTTEVYDEERLDAACKLFSIDPKTDDELVCRELTG